MGSRLALLGYLGGWETILVIADPTDDALHYSIPLQLEGVVSYIEYNLPTSTEFEDEDIPHLELKAESPAREPYNDDFTLQEESQVILISGDI